MLDCATLRLRLAAAPGQSRQAGRPLRLHFAKMQSWRSALPAACKAGDRAARMVSSQRTAISSQQAVSRQGSRRLWTLDRERAGEGAHGPTAARPEAAQPDGSGRGRPQRPPAARLQSWCALLPAAAVQRLKPPLKRALLPGRRMWTSALQKRAAPPKCDPASPAVRAPRSPAATRFPVPAGPAGFLVRRT